MVQVWQIQVRVDAGVAMAGKMLRAAEHPLLLQPPAEGTHQGGGGGGVLPPGPHIDHRIVGVVVDIAHGRQHPVQAHPPGFPSRAVAIAFRQGQGQGRIPAMKPAQGQGGHQPAQSLKALAHPFLHIGAEQQRPAGPAAQLVGAQAQFRGPGAEQDHPTDAGLQQEPELVIGGFPLGVAALIIPEVAAGPDHEQGGDQPATIARGVRRHLSLHRPHHHPGCRRAPGVPPRGG